MRALSSSLVVALGLFVASNASDVGASSAGPNLALAAPAYPLSHTVIEAARIARMRITAKVPQYTDDSVPASVCGYVLTAKVITAIKGGEEEFRFFLPVESDFNGFGQDYLVVAYSTQPMSRDQRWALGLLLGPRHWKTIEEGRCALATGNYVPRMFQTLWAFDRESGSAGGEEWVWAADREDALFCGHRASNGVNPQGVRIRDRHLGGGPLKYEVNWNDLKALLTRILHGENDTPDVNSMCWTRADPLRALAN